MARRKRWPARLAAAVLLQGLAVVSVQAQEAKCAEINDGSPFQLAGAKMELSYAAVPKKEDETPKHLRNTMGLLTTNPEKIKNENGRQYLLLRTYAVYLKQPSPQIEMKRGEMGFVTNPDGRHNLLMAIDSAASYLTTAVPKCQALFEGVRNGFYTTLSNNAIAALKAEKFDSVRYYVNLAQTMSPKDPRPWNILNAVYTAQNNVDSSVIAMTKIVELSGTDTLYKKIRNQAQYNLAIIAIQRAEGEQGAAKDQDIAKAKGYLTELIKETPDDANAKQALARTLQASGDTAAVTQIFNEMVTHPEKFTDIQLFEAASGASSARRDADAIKLFKNGLAKNAYHRDALYSYGSILFEMKDTTELLSIARRLYDIDPNSSNVLRLFAAGYSTRRNATKDEAKRKLLSDSVVRFLTKDKELNPRMQITAASTTKTGFAVAGSVENGGAAKASYVVKFQFLDKDGKTVASKDVTVGPVDAGASAAFEVKVDAPGAIGYKYAPMP